jgi:hypothetical protein
MEQWESLGDALLNERGGKYSYLAGNDCRRGKRNFEMTRSRGSTPIYAVRSARMCSSVPLLEPGPPRFFGGMQNNE